MKLFVSVHERKSGMVIPCSYITLALTTMNAAFSSHRVVAICNSQHQGVTLVLP
jgi:hypothetical protein